MTTSQQTTSALETPVAHRSLIGHVRIMRFDHWFKNVFVLPGIVLAWYFYGSEFDWSALWWRIPVGLLSVSLVASSNYVINEILDAPFDALHPTKHRRPVPSGMVHVRDAYVQWIVVGVAGLALAVPLGWRFFLCALALLVMGLLYNIRPFRFKDVAFVDVLVESINNPIRLLAGWYIAVPDARLVPLSLMLSYWMIGCYFMALKRFSELRSIGDHEVAATYRPPFARYTEGLLLVTAMGYGSAAMLFFGAFAVRYRVELLLAFPLIALVMAIYLSISLHDDSAAQAPELLYREPALLISCIVCTVAMLVLLAVDIPQLGELIAPQFPTTRVEP
jgi:4-hydroxybenzoate polyprenyltransferase